MDIIPANATLGAEIRGVDLTRLTAADFARIEQAWHAHAVLIFPGQHLDDAAHRAFTRRFGRLEQGIRRGVKGGFSRLSNVRDGKVVPPTSLQARFLTGNLMWHSDSSYKRVGAKASLLAARTVPADGGETEWADMRAGYDALDDDMKVWLEGRLAVHDYAYSHAIHGGLEILKPAELEALPPVRHPIVRVHPDTGRRNLFVGRHASYIVGEDLQTGRRLLRELTERAAQPPRTLTHKWRAGDLVLWDNRCVLHRGHRWPADQPRVMVRTTVAGDEAGNEWVLDEPARAVA